MDIDSILKSATDRLVEIKKDISTRTRQEIIDVYCARIASADGSILSVAIVEMDYQLYFDVERTSDGSYAITGDIEIIDQAEYIGMFDRELKFTLAGEE